MDNILTSDITKIKGVSDARKKRYNAIGIGTIGDLICHFPREYIDLTKKHSFCEELGEALGYYARVKSKNASIVRGGKMLIFTIRVEDENGAIASVKLFNTKFTYDKLVVGKSYYFYGRLTRDGSGLTLSSPQIFDEEKPCLMPIYSATASLSSKLIESHIKSILPLCQPFINEFLPREILERFSLISRWEAFSSIHCPSSKEALERARERLFFDEMFLTQVSLGYVKKKKEAQKGVKMENLSISEFISSLPFELSLGQQNAINDIIGDMSKRGYMNRLIEGDVGCGKTVVSACAMFFCAKNGYQSALMAPTEVLAVQHFQSISQMLAPFNINCVLLTGSLSQKEKALAYQKLESGEAMVCIGTHALISERLKFKSLALVVTDEQHRFGVRQRARLSEKGINPYTLVMSATPIPRTLSLIMYGDLDISIIEEMPKGRQEIDTFLINDAKRERAFGFIKKNIDAGGKAYIVCPLIDESERDALNLKSTEYYQKQILNGSFKGYKANILHGRLKSEEKDAIIDSFRNGSLELLVSTTVVEVGIDAPNATVMFIEDADRFGLSQLHQLRGRVGRGSKKSYCILMTSSKSHEALSRLRTFCQMKSGFDVALADLKLRGAGDVLGSRQHGESLVSSPIPQDAEKLLSSCNKASQLILEKQIDLSLEEKQNLRQAVNKRLEEVGESLN